MSLQYINDDSECSSSADNVVGDFPQWQKNMLDARLKQIEENPSCLLPIEGLIEELENEDD